MIIIFLLILITAMYINLISAPKEKFLKLPYITVGVNLIISIYLYNVYGVSVKFIQVEFLTIMLSLVIIADMKYQVIPNMIICIILLFGISFNLINSILSIENMLIGFFIISVPLSLMATILRGSMGGGDIKLIAASGVFLGWENIILSFLIGSLIGSLISIILIGLKKIKKNAMIPYGPFLAIGIFASSLYGDKIIKWYVGY